MLTNLYLQRKKTSFYQGLATSVMRWSFCIVVFIFSLSSAYADCGCNYTVPAGKYLIDGKALGIKPGNTVCLKAGVKYGNIKFINLIGTASRPITIKNCGGKVVINTSASTALKVNSSKYFRVTGSGDGQQYGIELSGAKSLGLSLGEGSTNFEIDHIEVHSIGFAGIMAKTDPACGKPYSRSQFTMYDIKLHDNYVHGTQGEGLYVGHSFYAKGRSTSCGKLMPHAIKGAKIYNNVVKRTGWDGIQVGSVIEGGEIYGNLVEDAGRKKNGTHGNGIQLGEGTGGKCYNNVIKNSYANGMIVLGLGDNVIFNNIIINSGGQGAFIDSRPPASPGKGFKFINNTVINAGESGVRIYATDGHMHNHVKNNIIVGGKEKVRLLHKGVTNTSVSNNYETNDINKVKFVNAGGGDYHLTSASPAVNKGADMKGYGVTFDMDKKSRPSSGSFDIGAYEYGGSSENKENKLPSVNAGSDRTLTLPSNKLTLEAKASDPDGSIASYEWVKESGPSSIKINNTKKAKIEVKDLTAGSYVLKVTVKDNQGASADDRIKITVKSVPSEDPPAPPAPASGNGSLSYTYYEGNWSKLPDFNKLKVIKSGEVANFDISPYRRNYDFAFQFKGYINVAQSGTYTFYTTSDDGSKLYINDKTVVSNDGLHAAEERSGQVYLSAGQHPIKVIYFENSGKEVLKVQYAGPDVSKRVIPSAVLSADKAEIAPVTSSGVAKAHAGADKTVGVGSAVQLSGWGTGPNPFREYQWSKVSGPSVTMKSQNTANASLSNVQNGTYVFRFTATDSEGNQNSDEMTLRVNSNARVATNAKSGFPAKTDLTEITYQVSAYPNPVQDQLNIAIEGAQGETLTLQLVDVVGKVIFQQQASVVHNQENISLNMQQYTQTNGLYYLIVEQASGERNTLRILKE